MNLLHYPQHHGRWSHVLMLLAVLAALASVRPAQATMIVRLVEDMNTSNPLALRISTISRSLAASCTSPPSKRDPKHLSGRPMARCPGRL